MLVKLDPKMIKTQQRGKVVRKNNTSQNAVNKDKLRGTTPLKGIMKKSGYFNKGKEIRWQVPLEKVIWVSRNRKLQESWQESFTKKTSVSKSSHLYQR